jgi:hypothetical protein
MRYYPFNNNITGGPASSIQSLGKRLGETTKQLNFGVDLGLLNKRSLNAEYYQRKTII